MLGLRARHVVPPLAALCLAGCASFAGGALDSAAYQSDIAARPTLSVVTTRRPVADGREPWFGGERGSRMSIARVELASPAQAGRLSLAGVGLVDWQIARVEKVPRLSIGTPQPGEATRDVLLYVHGYNQTFPNATLDAARLSDGVAFRGDTVLFSWPSRAGLFDYISDRESALWSRDALEMTLDSLLASPNIGRLNIVAHSLGSMVTIEALRQIYVRHGDAVLDKIGAIVFASPDLDIDNFAASVRRMPNLVPKMTIVTAVDDRALAVASRLAGSRRVGSAEKAQLESLSVKVVDASGLGWGLINHDLFLSNARVRQVIAQAIEAGRKSVAPSPDYSGSESFTRADTQLN
jgi:esterase/lipase superfamily enzyme